MSDEKVKELLFHTTGKQPGLIFAVIEQDSGPATQNKNTDVPSWCRYGHCWEMVELVEQECFEKKTEDCISTLPVSVDYYLYYFMLYY